MMRRTVAALLLLFPAGFRRRFGPDMLATFDARWHERSGCGRPSSTAADLLCAAVKERLSQRHVTNACLHGEPNLNIPLQDLTLRRAPLADTAPLPLLC